MLAVNAERHKLFDMTENIVKVVETPEWADRYQPTRPLRLSENGDKLFKHAVERTINILQSLNEIEIAQSRHEKVSDLIRQISRD